MKATGRFRMTWLMKLAASVLIAALLLATGWTAEKVYQSVTKKKSYYVELEKLDSRPVKFPDGLGDSSMSMSVVGTTIPADAPPGTVEKVKKHHEVMKQLIAEKKYKFIKTIEIPPGSPTEYSYRFTLPDGEHVGLNFSMSLENVASWEDYLQKRKEQMRQRHEKISKAMAAGKFRLLDVESLTTHVCKDVESNQTLLVLRIKLHDGKEIASVCGKAPDVRQYQTSWQDHLQAIRKGERVLLDLQITENYTYEITLNDGSTTIFTYGGSEPLKKPKG